MPATSAVGAASYLPVWRGQPPVARLSATVGHPSSGGRLWSAAPDHPHDLELVAGADGRLAELRAFHDLAVALHGHDARVDPDLLQQRQQRGRLLDIARLAIHLELDHQPPSSFSFSI